MVSEVVTSRKIRQNKLLAENIFKNIFVAKLEFSPAIRRPDTKNLISVPTPEINPRLKLCLSPRFSCASLLDDATPGEASPHKRRLKCDTKHQSQEADATLITSDGSKPYKPWRTLDTDNDNN